MRHSFAKLWAVGEHDPTALCAGACALDDHCSPDDLPEALGVAVSGGGDSVALLHMCARWGAMRAVPVYAVTIEIGDVLSLCVHRDGCRSQRQSESCDLNFHGGVIPVYFEFGYGESIAMVSKTQRSGIG